MFRDQSRKMKNTYETNELLMRPFENIKGTTTSFQNVYAVYKQNMGVSLNTIKVIKIIY